LSSDPEISLELFEIPVACKFLAQCLGYRSAAALGAHMFVHVEEAHGTAPGGDPALGDGAAEIGGRPCAASRG